MNRPSSSGRVVFLCPDYHYTSTLAREFNERGWQSQVLVPYGYPQDLLFSEEGTKFLVPADAWWAKNPISRFLGVTIRLWMSLRTCDLLIQYGRFPDTFIDRLLGRMSFRGTFNLVLETARRRGMKVVYVPSGCRDGDLRANFEKLDAGRVCGSCGFSDRCRDSDNERNLALVRKYSDVRVTVDMYFTDQYQAKMLRYKAIDFDYFDENTDIPLEHQLPPSEAVRILHAPNLGKVRSAYGRNIKGSEFVEAALKQLMAEGLNIEYVNPQGLPAQQMRFLQMQCDIIVDQLIYGSWGSTTIEALALGKATVCYIRPSWREEFLRQFSKYKDLPVVSATPETITDVLRELILDSRKRQELGISAKEFAIRHFDPKFAVDDLMRHSGIASRKLRGTPRLIPDSVKKRFRG